MTPAEAYEQMTQILRVLERLALGFHTEVDRADLLGARIALEAIATRLNQAIEEERRDD